MDAVLLLCVLTISFLYLQWRNDFGMGGKLPSSPKAIGRSVLMLMDIIFALLFVAAVIFVALHQTGGAKWILLAWIPAAAIDLIFTRSSKNRS